MARKTAVRRGKSGVSKAQLIRDEFEARGAKGRPKDIIAALAEKGVKVSSAQVSNIKAKLYKKRRGSRKAAAAGTPKVSVEALLEAKKMADKIGGVEVARRLLDALARLS